MPFNGNECDKCGWARGMHDAKCPNAPSNVGKNLFAITWSFGSGGQFGGVFSDWTEVVKAIKEHNPDYAYVVKCDISVAVDDTLGTIVYDDGFIDPTPGSPNRYLSDDAPIPGPEAYGI